MAKKVRVSPITETSTYDDIAEAVEEADASHVVETEIANEIKNETEPVLEISPEVKPKAKRKSRAKREAPKAPVEHVETLVESIAEELDPTAPKPKARSKRVAKVKVVEMREASHAPAVVEETAESTPVVVEKPKAVRKPRIPKETQSNDGAVPLQPAIPVRMSRMAAREKLCQNLVSNALP